MTPARLRPAADARPAADVRLATEADIPFVMATERGPGFEFLVGRWAAERHRTEMADPANAYLLGLNEGGEPFGFAILRDLDDPHGNLFLQRIAVRRPGTGFGRAFLPAVVAWAFAKAGTHRLWLSVIIDNERARRAYRDAGFREDGLLRESYQRPDGARVTQALMSMLRPEWEAAPAAVPFTAL